MTNQPTGTEARVCEMIAARQRFGLNKYGVQVSENPLSLRQWLVHLLEEQADALVYTMRAIEELDKGTLSEELADLPYAKKP